MVSILEQAQCLLRWKQQRLTKQSILKIEELEAFFSDQFEVHANERRYQLDHEAYLTFLKGFKANIVTLSHDVYQYYESGNTIIMPMRATVVYDSDKVVHYEAVKFFTFNENGKIVVWKEVAYKIP